MLAKFFDTRSFTYTNASTINFTDSDNTHSQLTFKKSNFLGFWPYAQGSEPVCTAAHGGIMRTLEACVNSLDDLLNSDQEATQTSVDGIMDPYLMGFGAATKQ